MTTGPDFIQPVSPGEVLAKLKTVDGTGSGLDADTVRGRQIPSGLYRYDFQPMFTPPPPYSDVALATLFGV
jgi:hypothetical protein